MTPTIREAKAEDIRLIHSSWHTSYWANHAKKRIDREVYKSFQDSRINYLLTFCPVLVAYFEEVPDEILGWACYSRDTLHYIYVRGSYRRRGIGSGLVPSGLKYYTHATDTVGGKFMAHHNLVFNPYRLEPHHG